jgi:hypothetical protein
MPLGCILVFWQNDSCNSCSRQLRDGVESYPEIVSHPDGIFLARTIPCVWGGTGTLPELRLAPDYVFSFYP